MTPGTLQKFLAVRRSDRTPTLYWWSLPLSPRDVAALYADQLAGALAVVQPANALQGAVPATPWPGGTAWVEDVGALLEARHEGRVGPCTIAVFPPTVRREDLEKRVQRFDAELERLGFTLAMIPEGDGRARHRFCFRVPGKVIRALEHLALGRGFGGDPGQVEMALLQGLGLRPKHRAALRLVMQDGAAALVREAGRRRIRYLESGRGYVGRSESVPLGSVLRRRWREGWRRFPVGVVMFAGLPFFIGAFWLRHLLSRRNAMG